MPEWVEDSLKALSFDELKATARPCTPWNFERDGFLDRQVMEDMVRVIINTKLPGGLVPVALAAPQVGIFKRFFVIACPGETVRWVVNPVVELLTAKRDSHIEGCLTVPGEKFMVDRFRSVSLCAFDHHGEPFKWAACKGLLGRIIQHEVDHLEGYCIKDFGRRVTTHRAGQTEVLQ